MDGRTAGAGGGARISRHEGVDEQMPLSSLAQDTRMALEALLFSPSHHRSLLSRSPRAWGTFHFPRGQLTHRLRACSTSFQALCLETKGKAILKPFKHAAIWQGPTKFGEMIPSLYPSPCISCPAWKEVCKTHPRAAERRTRALYLPDFPGDCHSTEDTWKVVKAQSCA